MAKIKVIRINTVTQAIGLSRSSIYRLVDRGVFPKQFKIGVKAVGWIEADIELWIESRKGGIQTAVAVH